MDPDYTKPWFKPFLCLPGNFWVPVRDERVWLQRVEDREGPAPDHPLDFVAVKEGPGGVRYAVWQDGFVRAGAAREYYAQRWVVLV